MARNKIGVGLDGKSNAFARGNEKRLAVHHTNDRSMDKPGDPAHVLGHRGHPTAHVADGKTVRATGALDIQPRQGASKALHPVALHGSMTDMQRAGAGIGGMGHSTSALSDGGTKLTVNAAAAPMADHYGGALPKSQPDTQVTWGNRHRNNDPLHGATDTARSQIEAGALHDSNKQTGRAILDEALANSGPDDRAAHGRSAKPTITVEK
jgi:hypothetical protein